MRARQQQAAEGTARKRLTRKLGVSLTSHSTCKEAGQLDDKEITLEAEENVEHEANLTEPEHQESLTSFGSDVALEPQNINTFSSIAASLVSDVENDEDASIPYEVEDTNGVQLAEFSAEAAGSSVQTKTVS